MKWNDNKCSPLCFPLSEYLQQGHGTKSHHHIVHSMPLEKIMITLKEMLSSYQEGKKKIRFWNVTSQQNKGLSPSLFLPKKYCTFPFNFRSLYCIWQQFWNSPGQQKQTNKASCKLNFLCWNRIACKNTCTSGFCKESWQCQWWYWFWSSSYGNFHLAIPLIIFLCFQHFEIIETDFKS